MPQLPESDVPQDDDAVSIQVCPTCSTPADVQGTGWIQLTCNNCETRYVVEVDPEKVAAHSI